jgi:hypothetical protein
LQGIRFVTSTAVTFVRSVCRSSKNGGLIKKRKQSA